MSVELSIKIIPFSRKKEDWDIWEEKFLARASRKGYRRIVELDETDIPNEETPEIELSLEQHALKRGNKLFYEDLILSIDSMESSGKIAFRLVKSCKIVRQPTGSAILAWKRLKEKYAARTAPTLVKLRREFATLKMTDSKKDPEEFITNLEELQVKLAEMGREITDKDLIIHILNNLPKEYDLQVEQLESRIDAGVNPLTMEVLRESLNLKFERIQDYSDTNNNRSDDKAFIGTDSNFKGRCHNCGKFGHKSVACQEGRGRNNRNTPQRELNNRAGCQGGCGNRNSNRNNQGGRGGNSSPFPYNCHY